MRISRRSGLVGNKKLVLYDKVDNTEVTGGWDGQRKTLSTSGITLATVSGSTSRASCYTLSGIDVTAYRKLCFTVSEASGGPIVTRCGGLSTATNTQPSVYQDITSTGRYVIDISNVTGSYYVTFWCVPNYNPASTTIIEKVWLE